MGNFSLLQFFQKVDSGSLIHLATLILVPIIMMAALVGWMYLIVKIIERIRWRRNENWSRLINDLSATDSSFKGGFNLD